MAVRQLRFRDAVLFLQSHQHRYCSSLRQQPTHPTSPETPPSSANLNSAASPSSQTNRRTPAGLVAIKHILGRH
jgi:hypothetical protein